MRIWRLSAGWAMFSVLDAGKAAQLCHTGKVLQLFQIHKPNLLVVMPARPSGGACLLSRPGAKQKHGIALAVCPNRYWQHQ
jgi:hypothetical protein